MFVYKESSSIQNLYIVGFLFFQFDGKFSELCKRNPHVPSFRIELDESSSVASLKNFNRANLIPVEQNEAIFLTFRNYCNRSTLDSVNIKPNDIDMEKYSHTFF